MSSLKACIPAFHQYFLTERHLQDPKNCFVPKKNNFENVPPKTRFRWLRPILFRCNDFIPKEDALVLKDFHQVNVCPY